MQVPTETYVMLSMVLFSLGVMGVLLKRNAILVFMSVELMLNAANLALAAFARQWGKIEGNLIVFFVITVAAAEVAVGLALIISIYRHCRTTNLDQIDSMKG